MQVSIFATRNLTPASEVVSDGLACFGAVTEAGCKHTVIRTGSGAAAAQTPAFRWVNTALGNIKAAIVGQASRVVPDGPVPSLMHRRRVLAKPIIYVGLDVHKDTIAVALAEAGLRGEVREHGKIPNTPAALKALTVKLAPAGRELRFCYEAGPCGYGIQRQLTGAGHECAVVAPSLIPRKPGERIKTDRRDAINLAKLHRAGELTVWVPDQAHEAIRDLVRARQAAVRTLRQARQQLSGFLLRHGRHYHRPAWTQLHRRWLASLKFDQRYIILCWRLYTPTLREPERIACQSGEIGILLTE